MTQKVTPFLWFDNNAEEAINLYTSLFRDAKVLSMSRYPEGGPMPAGTVMSATFQIAGQQFMALNGGPHHKFTAAFSLFVDCDTQEEVDHYWDKLCEGGTPDECGWLKDKFGLSWQIIPKTLGELLDDEDPAKSQRVMEAMMKMSKIDIAGLQRAYDAT